jgi:hypothetical protein
LQRRLSWPGGSYDWTERQASLYAPSAAGHLRFVITMQPSAAGGTLYLDDCKLYSWGVALSPGETAQHGAH